MSTQQLSPPPLSARTGLRENIAALGPMPVLMAATFVVILDFFIVNVALASMGYDLHAGSGSIEWVVAGYGVSLAVSLISAGRLGDAIGRRRTLCAGLVLFTLASAGCGAAPDAGILVASRFVQGLGAALISPSVLSIIGIAYDGPARARALSIYGLVLGLGAVSGQLIGGALIDLDPFGLTWRSCFLINLPIGAVAIAIAGLTIPESRAQQRQPFDLLGTALMTASLLALILPLVEGRQDGWPLWSWCSLAAAPLLAGVLLAQQRRRAAAGRDTLIAGDLLSERAFAGGLGLQLIFWAGQASFFLVLALYLQDGRGLSPIQAGGVFTVLAVAYLAGSARAPQLVVRHGRRIVATGAFILALGHAALWAALATGLAHHALLALVPGLILVGIGMGFCVAPLTAIALAPLNPERAGEASGAVSTVQQVGNSIGVAVTGAIFFGAARHGYGHAFQLSVAELAVLLLAVCVGSRLLPRR